MKVHIYTRADGFPWDRISSFDSQEAAEAEVARMKNCEGDYDDPMWATAEYHVGARAPVNGAATPRDDTAADVAGHVGRADFEERRLSRVERLRERASAKERESAARIGAADRVARMIPMGQPVLVGHHSERRHRRDLARIRANYGKGVELANEARSLKSRASAAAGNLAISSDDPNAQERIQAKIDRLKAERDGGKRANKLIRSAKGDMNRARELLAKEFAPADVEKLLRPDFADRMGVPAYRLTNIGAEIRRLEKRLAALDTNARAASALESTGDLQIGECVIRESGNRTQIVFPGKPSDETRALLKGRGFRWAPSEGAWQRMSSNGARYAAEQIAKSTATQK